MKELNFPQFDFKIKSDGAKSQIFDSFRKKWVALTPEEWVRQHVLRYLYEVKAFPLGLTAVEAGIEINGLKRRCDIVYYKTVNQPVFLVECKAPEVAISQAVFDQILRYNLSLGVEYLLVTNGIHHALARLNSMKTSFELLKEIPHFEELSK